MKKLLIIAIIATAALSVVSCGDDDTQVEGALSISGIPANATLTLGETLSVTNIAISAEDGISTFGVSINKGAEISLLGDDFTAGSTTYTASATLGTSNLTSGNITLIFTLTDADGDATTFTHTLVLSDVPIVAVTGRLTGTVNWTPSNIYQLNGKVVVDEGATLNIAAGTIIKGAEGEGSLASALVVARGGTLNISGTAAAPVVFTSVQDDIQPGQIAGSNLDETDNGLWGGLIILGSGMVSNGDGDTFGQIEGIPADELFGRYGYGDMDANGNPTKFQSAVQTASSGTMTYFSIRHGGALIGEGNEINGLTLGGVGSGTTINHIEVVANFDDGIEPFGGAVNINNALVWSQGDDAYDCDESYDGTITNFIYISGDESDHGFEIDGPKGSTHNDGVAKFRNGTFKGSQIANDGEYGDFRVAARIDIDGLYAFNFQSGKDFEIDDDRGSTNFSSGPSSLANISINSTDTLSDLFEDEADNPTGAWSNPSSFAIIVTSAPSTGLADATEFAGWTFADAKGELADF